ncbi:hypothetical protein SLS60_003693 [Paraconiothyrium brasiliense]|uniref:Uncharacterized protein n=1 Tax=Paraconiothyrium brasiliense TaxID=300254 RepID=A0ABR3RPC5_9PLEO
MAQNVPLNERGKNYKKNLRHYRTAKRKKLKARKMHLRIDANPDIRRTLRTTPRKAVRKATDARYIHPWIQNNAAFRLQECVRPTASLLGLPREIRQKILDLCSSFAEEDIPGTQIYWSRWWSARWRMLRARIGELSCVSPVLRVDMAYVGAQWKKQLRLEEEEMRARKEELRRPNLRRHQAHNTPYWRKLEREKGQVVEVKRRKKESKRKRSPKCWYCVERHPKGGNIAFEDPVCPMERRAEAKWFEETKVYKGKSTYDTRKIVFDD